MTDLRGTEIDAAIAANRVASRAALLRDAAGQSRWWLRPVYLFALGAMIYIIWTWSRPWSIAAYLLLLCVLALEAQTSRRLGAVVKLLEQLDTSEPSAPRMNRHLGNKPE
jgi:Flp pilus assembly protein TadB